MTEAQGVKKWGEGPRRLGNPIFKPVETGSKDQEIKNLKVRLDQIQREISRIRKQIHHLQARP
jgi:peptidoglycan hydrolase CwlO-like protein